MENKDSKSCSFLCFRNCNTGQDEDISKKINNPLQFEKLSLKKMKDEQNNMHRTNSFKKI